MDQSNIHLIKLPNRDDLLIKAAWLHEHGYYTHLTIHQVVDMLEKQLDTANTEPKR